MEAAIRKCGICKSNIEINNPEEDFFAEERNKTRTFFHCSCYIHKQTNKKRSPKSIEECMQYIEECKSEYQNYLEQKQLEAQEKERSKQQKLQEEEKEKNSKLELYEFLFDMYDVSYLPQYFYIKMASVYNGTMKNLNRPVPAEDLLDMWRQKRAYLDKVAENNQKKGNEMSGAGRINYDLAILLSKYDSYLKWKEQQKIAVAELNESKKRSIEKIEYTDVARPKTTVVKNEKIDINSMLDEI